MATNNTFYLDNSSADAHDILLCVKDGEKLSTPKGRGRGYRFGLPNNEYYFKSQDQMREIFADIPSSLSNTNEIVSKIEAFDLTNEVFITKIWNPGWIYWPKR